MIEVCEQVLHVATGLDYFTKYDGVLYGCAFIERVLCSFYMGSNLMIQILKKS